MDDFTAELQAFSQRVLNKETNLAKDSSTKEVSTIPEKEVVLYQTDDGNIDVSVYYYEESFWLTQKAMGELFGVASNTITYHLQEIFKSGELLSDSVTRIFRATASDGKNYNTKFYKSISNKQKCKKP